MSSDVYDVVVVGGGFFGAAVALEARRHRARVLLIEREAQLMQRASFANQARIHRGYHYPRSLLTAERARATFDWFSTTYSDCVVRNFDKLYAIARDHSNVSSAQFLRFCERIGAPIEPAPAELARLFSSQRIEAVFAAQEYAFDAMKLRGQVEHQLERADVEVCLGVDVTAIRPRTDEVLVHLTSPDDGRCVATRWLFNCTYAALNRLLENAGLEHVPLDHELVELALVHPPAPLDRIGVTVMDGPFFSCMPFPAARAHSLTHVRYTPHRRWRSADGTAESSGSPDLERSEHPSLIRHMIRDAARYLPLLADVRYERSLWEVKTLLPRSQHDDSRPVLFHRSILAPSVVSVLGAKIDNVIDAREHVAELLACARPEPT